MSDATDGYVPCAIGRDCTSCDHYLTCESTASDAEGCDVLPLSDRICKASVPYGSGCTFSSANATYDGPGERLPCLREEVRQANSTSENNGTVDASISISDAGTFSVGIVVGIVVAVVFVLATSAVSVWMIRRRTLRSKDEMGRREGDDGSPTEAEDVERGRIEATAGDPKLVDRSRPETIGSVLEPFPDVSSRETDSGTNAIDRSNSDASTADRRLHTIEEYDETYQHLLKLLPKLKGWEIQHEEIEYPEPMERIGFGGYGEVYKGRWRGTPVAVKRLLEQQLNQEGVKNFCSEIAILAKLRHPQCVLFLGACIKPPNLSIVMELVVGTNLFEHLHRATLEDGTIGCRRLTHGQTIKGALSICRGMLYLHQCNPPVIHRDLTAKNILINRNGHLKITDFGLSKTKQSFSASFQSQHGGGTIEYLAPEVIRGEKRQSEKVDVFSFGVVLWEMMTSKIPWFDTGLSTIQVVTQVHQHGSKAVREALPFPEDARLELVQLVLDCWEEDPETRTDFASIHVQLLRMLEQI